MKISEILSKISVEVIKDNPIKTHKGIVCFDFDGVISSFDGYKGPDLFGDPIKEVVDAMKILKDEGYYINIFTGRLDTPEIRKWLEDNKVSYDAINSNSHNPPFNSEKPYYDCFVDDRAVNFNWKHNRLNTDELVKKVKDVVDKSEKVDLNEV